MTLLDQLHEIGLPMRGRYAPHTFTTLDENNEPVPQVGQRYVGWTTDQAKADAAREAGATVTSYRASDPMFSGWEVSVTEIIDAGTPFDV